MDRFWEFLKGPVGSVLRVFAGLVLGSFTYYVTEGGHLHDLTWTNWEAWFSAAVVAVFPVAIAWLNPADPRFGLNKEG